MLTVTKELKKLCNQFAVNKLFLNLNTTNDMIFNYIGKKNKLGSTLIRAVCHCKSCEFQQMFCRVCGGCYT